MMKPMRSLVLLSTLLGACGLTPELPGGTPSPDAAAAPPAPLAISGEWRSPETAQRFRFLSDGTFAYSGPDEQTQGTYAIHDGALRLDFRRDGQPRRTTASLFVGARALCIGEFVGGAGPGALGQWSSALDEDTLDEAGAPRTTFAVAATLQLLPGEAARLTPNGEPTATGTYAVAGDAVRVRFPDRPLRLDLKLTEGGALCAAPYRRM